MADYCDPDDLARYGVNALALESLSLEENQAPPIAAASSKIDSYLRNKYTLPLVRFGQDLRECAAILAAWNVVRIRGIKPGENLEDLPLYMAYKEQLAWLKLIADGQVAPDVQDSSDAAPGVVQKIALVSSNQQRGYQGARGGPFQGRR